MSTTTITLKLLIGGTLTDPTSAVLADPTSAFGVKRLDTGGIVVASGTTLVKQSTGIWAKSFTDPAAGLVYSYWITYVVSGATYRIERQTLGGAAGSIEAYVTLADADELAGQLPSTVLAAFNAASDSDKVKALVMASVEIDRAMRYQGRKYGGPSQEREFPRMASVSGAGLPPQAFDMIQQGVLVEGDEVWDLDADGTAIVPANVKLAAVYQANSILAGDRDETMDARHNGLAQQSADGLSEAYGGAERQLCRRAHSLMVQYELRSGSML